MVAMVSRRHPSLLKAYAAASSSRSRSIDRTVARNGSGCGADEEGGEEGLTAPSSPLHGDEVLRLPHAAVRTGPVGVDVLEPRARWPALVGVTGVLVVHVVAAGAAEPRHRRSSGRRAAGVVRERVRRAVALLLAREDVGPGDVAVEVRDDALVHDPPPERGRPGEDDHPGVAGGQDRSL